MVRGTDIEWRAPEAAEEAERTRLWGVLSPMTARMLSIVVILVGGGWLAQRQWLPELEMPWLVVLVVGAAFAAAPAAGALLAGRVPTKYSIDDKGIWRLGGRSRLTTWESAVAYRVESHPDATSVEELRVYDDSVSWWVDLLARLLGLDSADATVERHQLALPDESTQRENVIAAVAERLPGWEELGEPRRAELKEGLRRREMDSSGRDATLAAIVGLIWGVIVALLLWHDALPSLLTGKAWFILLNAALLVVGPGLRTFARQGRSALAYEPDIVRLLTLNLLAACISATVAGTTLMALAVR